MKPVKFQIPVGIKSLDNSTTQTYELENGDLIIQGIGANYDIDREGEAFVEGAFSRGLKNFLSGGAALCYHHKMDTVIGRVLEASPVPGKGIELKAIVYNQPETSPLYHIYQNIKRGSVTGLSVGGFFKRTMTKAGPRINDVDILEWSVTPVPVGAGAQFSVIAGKAVATADEEIEQTDELEVVQELEKSDEEQAKSTEEGSNPGAEESPAEEPEQKEETPTAKVEIEPGSITVDHLSPELLSHFQELAPEVPKIEDVQKDVEEIKTSLEALTSMFDDLENKNPWN